MGLRSCFYKYFALAWSGVRLHIRRDHLLMLALHTKHFLCTKSMIWHPYQSMAFAEQKYAGGANNKKA
ncbi:MAG: hypothetical protein RR696_00445 [Clostridia bacterium]